MKWKKKYGEDLEVLAVNETSGFFCLFCDTFVKTGFV